MYRWAGFFSKVCTKQYVDGWDAPSKILHMIGVTFNDITKDAVSILVLHTSSVYLIQEVSMCDTTRDCPVSVGLLSTPSSNPRCKRTTRKKKNYGKVLE